MSSVDDMNSLSSSSLLVRQDDGCSSSDDAPLNETGIKYGRRDNTSSVRKRNYGWRNVQHLLEDNKGSRRSKQKVHDLNSAQRSVVQQKRQRGGHNNAYTRRDSESSGSLPNDLMAIPSMIAPPSWGGSEGKRSKHHAKYDHPVARQRKFAVKRKDSESSDDYLVGSGRPTKSLRENDLMAIPSMIAPPKPSPRRRSDIPQQRPVPKPSPLPKHPGRRARSFMSPRDRRMLAGKYKRNQRQQNNTVVDSPRNNIQQRPQRMNHTPIDTMASTTSSHDESQPRITSPQHLPHVNIGTPIKTPQYTASIDFNDEQLHYKSVEETSLEGMGDYQSEMFPPLSPDKSLFSHATEASGSPPKTLFSYWLSPPSNKHRKYSSSDEDESTFDGLSTMYSSMVPSDFGSPARQAQTINADDVEFHPRPFDDLMSPPDKKWSDSVDLVSRCPESPITPQDQLVYGHLHNNYPERSFTPSRKIEYDNEFHGSTIVQDEIEVESEFESSASYPPQDTQPTNPVGEKKRPVAIKKTKLKSASCQQHQRRKWDFNNLDAV